MMSRVLRLAALTVLLTSHAFSYYHFVHFGSRFAPFRPIPEKFDLVALPNKTLNYFIDDASGLQLAPGDSYASLVSQLRAAAGSWNDVDSSDLRLAFGGFVSPGASQNSPSVDILFEEVPPGLIALGGPTVCGTGQQCRDVRVATASEVVPIVKSVVLIQSDLRDLPSHTERLYTTLVHEFGHALGLQHTLTSSVMSTAITRSTSKARPLSTDDIAGISILYPKANFVQTTGSIAGRVVLNGQGVNLASVVAITSNGAAISALTNPDGTYRIDGLPPRNYFVYVHPLPPARLGQSSPADIIYPVDPAGAPWMVGAPFETVFYNPAGSVKDSQQASQVPAAAGVPTQNINFSVRQRSGYNTHSVETYAFPGGIAVKPPYLSPGMANPFFVATGSGLVGAAGLRATVLGGADLTVHPYSLAPTSYLQFDFDPRTLAVPSNSPRHLLLASNSDIYVLPSAFFHVDRQPPQIAGVQSAGGLAVLTGVNLNADTRVLFDGIPAQIRNVEDIGGNIARITALPPPGAPGQRSVIAAFNSDGQSSLFIQSDAPPVWIYPGNSGLPVPSAATVTPANLSIGTEALVQIDGLNTAFAEGQVAVGFGSSDIAVRRIWAISPTRLLVNVAVAAAAQPGALHLTLANGLQILQQSFALQVQTQQPGSFWLSSTFLNPLTGQASLSAGSMAAIIVGSSPVPLSTTNVVVVLNETRIAPLAVAGNQISFQIPANLPPGVATLRVEAGTERSLPIGMPIDPPPPRILSATVVSADRILRLGDRLILSVANLHVVQRLVGVRIGNKDVPILQLIMEEGKDTVVVQLPDDTPTGEGILVTVSADRRISDPVSLTITK